MPGRGNRIPDDLRWAIVRMARSEDLHKVSEYTGVSMRQIFRILALYRATGTVSQAKDRGRRGRHRQVTTDEVLLLQGCVNKECDMFLDELREALEAETGRRCSLDTIWRALNRSGYTVEKLTREAIERSAEKRAEFAYRIGTQYSPEQLVFVDESACERRMSYRGKVWAMKGSRATRKSILVRGNRYSMLPALSLSGILHLKVVEGSFTIASFSDFIAGLLEVMNPYPGPNSVIVMDECHIHKADLIIEMIEDRGMRVEFLPPYSPDLNPIELALSAIKANIRRSGEELRSVLRGNDRPHARVIAFLWDMVYSVTPEDAHGFFRRCGYIL